MGAAHPDLVRPAADAIAAFFAGQPDLPVEVVEAGRSWFTVLRGEHKRTIPVHLRVGARELVVESFVMQAPDQGHDEVYANLLRRNTRTYVLRFALADTGDVILVGVLPLAAVDVATVDQLLGQVLVAADEAYDPLLRAGFSDYIEAEQAWRAKVGMDRNPIT